MASLNHNEYIYCDAYIKPEAQPVGRAYYLAQLVRRHRCLLKTDRGWTSATQYFIPTTCLIGDHLIADGAVSIITVNMPKYARTGPESLRFRLGSGEWWRIFSGAAFHDRSIWYYIRADFMFAPSQWETALLCNDVSHWLGANLESFLLYVHFTEDIRTNISHRLMLLDKGSVSLNKNPVYGNIWATCDWH